MDIDTIINGNFSHARLNTLLLTSYSAVFLLCGYAGIIASAADLAKASVYHSEIKYFLLFTQLYGTGVEHRRMICLTFIVVLQ